MRGLAAPLALVAARARRRPGRWLPVALGIALATAFGGVVAAEGVIAGDQSARSVLSHLSAVDRPVRVSAHGVVSPDVERQARGSLRRLGLGAQTEVVLLDPVRLSGVVVRPAAISPLGRWLAGNPARRLGHCRAENCPMLLASAAPVPSALTAIGVRIRVAGRAPAGSAAPLGFSPNADGGPPVLLTGDVAGLASLAGLSGVYRSHSWLASLATARLHSWQLTPLLARLRMTQAILPGATGEFSLEAPFTGLAQARAEADAGPRRLLLAGGGAIAALTAFILLAAGGLRRDQAAELARLRNAGARASQSVLFVAAESGWLSAVALLVGAGAAIGAAAVRAGVANEPVGGVLTHSLLTPAGVIVLFVAWLVASALIALSALSTLSRGTRVADMLAVASVAALAAALLVNTRGDDSLALLLAPLGCLAAGVLVFRIAAALLRAGERVARRGPVLVRLAFVDLARAPALPSLTIAFVAVSTGLGGFALAYRATLIRGAADQAADRVPLDAIVSPGPNFTTPLELAPLARWRSIAAGTVLPVRRTEADYASGGSIVTVPALGIPAAGMSLIRGWRASDGSAPLAVLGRRLRPPDPVRVSGPKLPISAQELTLKAFSASLDVSVSVDLRDPEGAIRQLALGTVPAHPALLRARLPRGRWQLEALELDEPTGLQSTNGHQNAENPGAPTQFQARVAVGPLQALRADGRPLISIRLGSWTGVGAAARASSATGRAAVVVRFATSGVPGIVRPVAPSDSRSLPVVVDPQTAASAGNGGRLALTVDGQPISARVVGVVKRFPTIAADASGVVVADEATLSGALDAQLPGQGRADELWVASAHPPALRAALKRGPLVQLSSSFRRDLEYQLGAAAIARGVLGTLLAAAALSAALATLGLLATLLGPVGDEQIERDLEEQGIGPRGLRTERRMRLLLASVLGVCAGVGIAVLLTRLAVAGVRAAETAAVPRPSLVTVVPWVQLTESGVIAIALLTLTGWLATRWLFGRER